MSAIATYMRLRAFADELARCGLEHACTSPGSRSAPLVISLVREPRIRCHSHIDERCAGFFALGAAKASGRPVAIVCTSGTAVAELAPAVVEAHEARVPLLVLSADRPAELRERGAGQTIDQLKLFGGAVKWFFEVEQPPGGTREARAHGADADRVTDGDDDAALRFMRTLACRAYWRALDGRPGPVHLNFPLREPLVPERSLPREGTGRPGGVPYVSRPAIRPTGDAALARLADAVAASERGVLVAGRYERSADAGATEAHAQTAALGPAAARFCEARGWPLLADPLSGARTGTTAIANYDAVLRARGPRAATTPGGEPRAADGPDGPQGAPDLVLRVGDLPTSKPLRRWLASLGDVTQIALDPDGAWQDPDSVLALSLPLAPASALDALAERDRAGAAAARSEWLEGWRSVDERAAEAVTGALAGDGLSEPAIARELGILLPADATLFVASSMPVRDIECFWPARPGPPRALCNRGANGIDGTVSAAFGAAAAQWARGGHNGRGPVVLLIGDVALAHDLGGLIAARRLRLPLTIVLLNNDGGGIFDFLPVARAAIAREHYGEHVTTPPGIDFARAAALYGLGHELPGDLPAFRAALERALASGRPGVVEVRTDRAENVAVHERIWRAVGAALAG